MNRFKNYYNSIVKQDLIDKFLYENPSEINKFEKLSIKTTQSNIKDMDTFPINIIAAFYILTGKLPKLTKSKKTVANFKIKKGNVIGCKVILSNNELFFFLDKITTIVLPKIEDFEKFNKNQINKNNFTLGIKDLFAFPEIEHLYKFFNNKTGLDISIKFKSTNEKDNKVLLSAFLLPF